MSSRGFWYRALRWVPIVAIDTPRCKAIKGVQDPLSRVWIAPPFRHSVSQIIRAHSRVTTASPLNSSV